MAINENINPWAVGAVAFDQRPAINFAQQQMARQQAKDSALDNYFKDLNKSVTSAGMRSQDVPALVQKQKEWQQFYIQNKAAIANPKLDNGDAYTRYMAGHQDQLGLVNESKEAYKQKEQLGKLKFNKDFNHVFDDPKVLKDIELDDLPIGHPDRKALNVSTMATPPKPWGIKENEDFSRYLTQGLPFDEVPGKTEKLPGFKTRTEIIKQYSPESQATIGHKAMRAYDTDKNVRLRAEQLQKEITANPQRYSELNQIFNKVYKDDIQFPQEALAAQAILDESRRSKSYKEGTDDVAKDLYMMKMRQANAKELIRYKKDIDPDDADLTNAWVDNYLGRVVDDAKKKAPMPFRYEDGRRVNEYDIPLDPTLSKAMSFGKFEPDALRVDDDGNFRRVVYLRYGKGESKDHAEGDIKKDKTGWSLLDKTYSEPLLSKEQVEVALGKKALTPKNFNKYGASKFPNKSNKPIDDLRKKYDY